MAKEKGTVVLVKVGDGGSPEVFTAIAGQRTGSIAGSSDPIDVSDKTSNGWRSYLAGMKDATITCDGIAKWPDTAGLNAVINAWLTDTTINMEMVINSAGSKFSGPYQVTQCQISGDYDGATEYSLQFSPTDAVTYTAAP